ncbi:uncharacterized protein LOC116853293 [Odontomachus brunneus]|uniref:uncharacterized protein LOC116853293 n=1 Tax=Odontomachus brunneus TaxID=486640 RepID=UPI0013F26327|nr:uncharacterized protein LOC116853293 [Odontomachus brunneus]
MVATRKQASRIASRTTQSDLRARATRASPTWRSSLFVKDLSRNELSFEQSDRRQARRKEGFRSAFAAVNGYHYCRLRWPLKIFFELLAQTHCLYPMSVRLAGGHMVKQRRFIGNTNNKMINIREHL